MPPADLSTLKIDERSRSTRSGHAWRWVAIATVVLAMAAALVFAVWRRALDVEVATVHAATSGTGGVALLNASGYITPRRRSTIAAKITARVEQMYAEEGMHVTAGQVLAVLDQSDAKVRLASAVADRDSSQSALKDLQVNLANAEVELRRTEELQKDGISTQQALDTATTTVKSYRARIAQAQEAVRANDARIKVAQQDLDNCTVRAPFSGIVVSKDAQRGEMVSPISAGGGFTRTGIATVVDMDSNEVEVDVNESYIARVKDGQKVISVLDAYPDWKIPSHVRTVIPTADRQKATVKVRISFDRLDPRILPDMGVKVSFLDDSQPGQEMAAKQVMVPRAAIRDDNGSSVVFLYRDGRVERRAVRLGTANGNEQEVLAGLVDGDQVVTRGQETLRDGEKVAIKQ